MNQQRFDVVGDPEIRNADRAIRNGVPHADVGAGTDGHFKRIQSDARYVWTGRDEAGNVSRPTACWLGRLAERGVPVCAGVHPTGWDQHGNPAN